MKLRLAPSVLAAAMLLAIPAFATQAELIVPTSVQPDDHTRARLDSLMYDFAVVELDTADLSERVRSTGEVSVYINDQRFDLLLEPNDLRAPGYREVVMFDHGPVTLPERPVTTFKGQVLGDPSSDVRLSVTAETFQGYVRTGDEWVFIEPLRRYSDRARAGRMVVYREAAVRPEAKGECGIGHVDREAERMLDIDLFAMRRLDGTTENHHERRSIQVATEADGQMFQRYGNPGVFNVMTDILNGVDGIYGTELNLDVTVVYQQAWQNPSSDPYTSLDAVTTLSQLRNWWQANNSSISRDAVHMFSGKTFSGGTIGLAYVGSICVAPSFAYGLSQDQSTAGQDRCNVAHQIAHNLGATHACCADGGGGIMCNECNDTFSECSREEIVNHVHENGSCL